MSSNIQLHVWYCTSLIWVLMHQDKNHAKHVILDNFWSATLEPCYATALQHANDLDVSYNVGISIVPCITL